ncbi:MAG: hypothetical protein JSW58_09510 [Candidatus Latescibacterota bacterium]|nr:MAG: hypothetical protein JSW58_09510 [Candidatus Latescibacterota bacterium]
MKFFKFTVILLASISVMCFLGCGTSSDNVGADGERYTEDGVATGETPAIQLVDIGECKNFSTGIPRVSAPSDQDCIEFWYVGGSVLNLRHVNAGFNCCPVVDVDIRVEGDVITIEEIEIEGMCACLCLFDVNYEIQNLAPGVYHLVVIEPYLPTGDPVLEFDMDLTSEPTGRHCVPRSQYPWGF